MTRLLITGGSGYLGRHLVGLASEELSTAHTFHHRTPAREQGAYPLDLREENAVLDLLETLAPDVIVDTAGSWRSPDSGESIRSGASHLARGANAIHARLIYVSTDVVFDGREAPYDETAQPRPLHAYGKAKAEAEDAVRAVKNHVIVRTSLIYGLEEMDHQTRWMREQLRSGETLTLFTDQRRNPVWLGTLSRALLELAVRDFVGILNVAGRQVMARADYAKRLLNWWGVDTSHGLRLSESDGERWPRDCELDLARAQALLETPLLGFDEVLERASR